MPAPTSLPLHRAILLATGAVVLTFFASVSQSSASPADARAIVDRWLASGNGVSRVRIDFEQTRTLKTLKLPVRKKGSLWVDYDEKKFRWQIGDPPGTIVVGDGKELLILRTAFRKYERRPLGGGSGAASGAPAELASLARGLPRTWAQFEREYRVLEVLSDPDSHEVVTQPRDGAGRGVRSLTYVFNRADGALSAMKVALVDGSAVTTAFESVQRNPPLGDAIFQPDLSGYRETDGS